MQHHTLDRFLPTVSFRCNRNLGPYIDVIKLGKVSGLGKIIEYKVYKWRKKLFGTVMESLFTTDT